VFLIGKIVIKAGLLDAGRNDAQVRNVKEEGP
jgi:hypothetical protein